MKVVRSQRPLLTRDEAVTELQRGLQSDSWPRVQMTLLVAITGGAGLLSSFLTLQAGVTSMALRYPLALTIAYAAFFLLLWLWLRTKTDDWTDFPDPGLDLPMPTGRSTGSWTSGGGGNFSGGGASANFDTPVPLQVLSPGKSGSVSSDVGSGLADGLGSIGDASDADELVVPVLVIALVMGLALSSFYVIYSAPTLFAELLLDGALSASLYKRLRGIKRRHWVFTALRRTALPFVLTALFLAAVGWGLQTAVPGAHSVGEVLHHGSAAL